MLLSDISVKRPVMATVASLLLVVFGILCYTRLPLREYPDIDSPIVSIRTNYTGASANVIEARITKTIEDSVSGISGLKTIQSRSEDGSSSISLEFYPSTNINEAANDVRDKVARVASKLPDEADTPRVSKRDADSSSSIILTLYHPNMSQMQLTDFAKRNLVDTLSVVEGVSEVRIFGEKRPSMRIWIDRKALAARGLTAADIEEALLRENVELPAGRLESNDMEFVMRLDRLYHNPEEFGRLVIKEGSDGHLIRLKDVAEITKGPATVRDSFTSDGKNAVGIAISKQSKANTLQVINSVKDKLPFMRSGLPDGMELAVCKDDAVFIEAAISEVYWSLAISGLLVFFIIYLFLGNFRAALIPAVTVPISLISSFIVLYIMGYSINLLTLLSLVLAIGLVVDDSIVALENIHRHIEEGSPPLVAAFQGAREVGFAVMATTIVLVAVFMPLCLLEGNTGKLFSEFAVAIMAAVCFSSFVALTLSPVLCSIMLKAHEKPGKLARVCGTVFFHIENVYEKTLRAAVRRPALCFFFFILFCGLSALLYTQLPSEFEPAEDRAILIMNMKAPEGSGLGAAKEYMNQVKKEPEKMLKKGEARHVLVRIPGSHNSLGAVNSGRIYLLLEYWDKRKRTSESIMEDIYAKTSEIPGVKVSVYQPSGLSTNFRGQPVQFVIGGPTYEKLIKWRDIILEEAKKYPGLKGVDSDYQETMPQMRVRIDRDRANKLGVSASVIGRTLETMLGSKNITTYIEDGEEYDVILQGKDEDRKTPGYLRNIYVRSRRTGKLLPLSNLVNITEQADSSKLNRFNRQRAITISGSVVPGYSLEDCLNFLEKTVKEKLPAEVSIDYKGMSKDFKESSLSVIFVFVLAVLIVFLALAAQFESFVSPFVIMLTVPMGILGALAGLMICGSSLNIYSQIGLIMLVGLAAKNGILIVEFANQQRDSGFTFESAVFQASKQRLRPIAMTGLSTAIGAIPLLLATGAGRESRISLGAVIFFGATVACIFTLYVVPVGIFYLSRNSDTPGNVSNKLKKLMKDSK